MENKSGGITFSGLLTCIFIVLKLTNIINWSWWWVLSPIWLPIIMVLGIGIILVIIKAFLKK